MGTRRNHSSGLFGDVLDQIAGGGAAQSFQEGLKSALGGVAQSVGASREVSGKCAYCGAPLVGTSGKTVRCPYCDGEQDWPPAGR